MGPEQMLRYLTDLGEDNASDFDDAQGGWFGWRVENEDADENFLVVTFEPDDGSGVTHKAVWQLVLVAREAA